jgi:hypothetical protein
LSKASDYAHSPPGKLWQHKSEKFGLVLATVAGAQDFQSRNEVDLTVSWVRVDFLVPMLARVDIPGYLTHSSQRVEGRLTWLYRGILLSRAATCLRICSSVRKLYMFR